MKPGAGYSHIANWAARLSGRPATFLLAVSVVLLWVVTGPVFHFSDTWQLV
ncbi:MAG TPA: low affinity iron permease family protein, partial [Burkholderiales bacterium]|nr:low affinity iron permease family protein [Burkholderiales bacterium]